MQLFKRSSVLVLAVALAACSNSNGELGTTSIANGQIKVWGEKIALRVDDAPEALITTAGDFSVDGKSITVTPAQRDELRKYALAALSVREHGLATGKAGAGMAGATIKGLANAAVSADSSKIDSSVNEQTKKIQEEAAKICQDLVDINTAQNALAKDLAEFKPYARIITDDRNTCTDKDDGADGDKAEAKS